MPRIPTYEQQTAPSGRLVAPQIGVDQGAGLRGLGHGLGVAAYVVDRQLEREAAAEAAVTLSQLQVDSAASLAEMQRTLQPGAPEFTPKALKQFDDNTAKLLAGAKSRRSRAFLTESTARLRVAYAGKAMEIEATERDRHQNSQFSQAIELAATAAELDPNPDSWKERLAEQNALIDDSGMGEADRALWRTTAQERITGRKAVAEARRDPSATLKRLVQPEAGDTLFRNLSPKARDAVLQETEAQQRALQQSEDRAYTLAKRAEGDMNDAAQKDGDLRLANGSLTTGWIEANRGRLSPDDYRYFYRELSGGSSTDTGRGAEAYADLRDRASNGQDVRVDARAKLTAGEINVAQYDRLLGEVESSRPNWYKRGSSYLSTVSGYSDLNPTPAAAQTKARMLDDWAEWAQSNPKADDRTAHDAYQRIADEYSIIDTKKVTLTMRAPRFLQGSRRAPDIEATVQRTVDAFQKGEISREEFEQQAELLKQWEAATANQAAKAKQP